MIEDGNCPKCGSLDTHVKKFSAVAQIRLDLGGLWIAGDPGRKMNAVAFECMACGISGILVLANCHQEPEGDSVQEPEGPSSRDVGSSWPPRGGVGT